MVTTQFCMPVANREGLILAAANDLTTALLHADNNKILPPLSTDATKQLVNLRNISQTSTQPQADQAPTSSPAK